MSLLRKADSAEPASWVVNGLRGFAETVGSLVPEGFEAYARVFHPAWTRDADPVTWAEIAATNGRVLHATAQWPHVAFTIAIDNENQLQQPPPGTAWHTRPKEGSLDQVVAKQLISILRRFTATPDQCWFAFWEGWGDPVPLTSTGTGKPDEDFVAAMNERRAAPHFKIPGRGLYLFQGAIEACLESWYVEPSSHPYQSPMLWWPDDRAWFVSTDVDLESTYIGAARVCIEALVADESIEVLDVDIEAGITWASDEANPNPMRQIPIR